MRCDTAGNNQVLYEFCGFFLDDKQRTLVHNGGQITLTSKVFDTLVLLVRNSGQLVKKEDMMETLWPESFVDEGNLSQNICVLRKALGCGPEGETLIQTVPRQGYRFAAPVQELDTHASVNGSNGHSPTAKPTVYWTTNSPFRGLQVFEPEDSWLFFGRDREVQELGERLYRSPMLAVVGNSGSGKSSLVRAGLIAALKSGRIGNGLLPVDSWRIVLSRPSNCPFDSLAEVLPGSLAPSLDSRERAALIADSRARFPIDKSALRNAICGTLIRGADNLSRTRVLLIVDQFEEIFTLSSNHELRIRYIDALLAACQMEGPAPTHLLLILRADFYANCLEHRELSHCLEGNIYNLPQMGLEQMRESVERRLALAGAHAEPGLVDSLLSDAGAEPGNLALLEHALSQLWQKCGGYGGTLTRKAYLEIGGLQGSLSSHADEVYRAIGDEHQRKLAQRIFLELVRLGEGTRDAARRVSKSDLLLLAEPGEIEAVLLKLAASRLISIGGEKDEIFVEVSHETLIRKWPALRDWLAQNREAIHLERRLMQAAHEWNDLEKESGALLQGARLLHAEEWLAKQEEPAALLREFIRSSAEARDEAVRREREAEQQALAQRQAQLKLQAENARAMAAEERRRAAEQADAARQLRYVVIALLFALLCAILAAVLAWKQWQRAKQNEQMAEESAAAARLHHTQAEIAMLIARARESEAQALRRENEAVRAERKGDLELAARLRNEAAGSRKFARRFLLAAEQPEQPLHEGWRIDREIAEQATRRLDQTLRQLQSERTGAPGLESSSTHPRPSENRSKASQAAEGDPLPGVSGLRSPAALTITGDALSMRLTAEADQNLRRDSNLSVWLALYAFKSAKSVPVRENAEVMLRKAAWKAEALPVIQLTEGEAPVAEVRFSSDNGSVMILGKGRPKQLDLWDLKTSNRLLSLTPGHARVVAASFSGDGQRVAMSASDGVTKLWDIKTWQPLRTIHDSSTIDLSSLSPDGKMLLSSGTGIWSQSAIRGSWVHLWNLSGPASENTPPPFLPLPGFAGPVTAMEFNADSTLFALGSATGAITLYSAMPGRAAPIGNYEPGERLPAVKKIIFSGDAQKLAALDVEGNLSAWRLSSDHQFHRLEGWRGRSIVDAAFSSDGRLIAVAAAGRERRLEVLDASSGQRIDLDALAMGDNAHWTAALSPNGQVVAITDNSRRRLRVYALDTARMVDFTEKKARRKLTADECQLYLQQTKCPPLR